MWREDYLLKWLRSSSNYGADLSLSTECLRLTLHNYLRGGKFHSIATPAKYLEDDRDISPP